MCIDPLMGAEASPTGGYNAENITLSAFHGLLPPKLISREIRQRDLSAGVLIGEFEGLGAKPLRADDGDQTVGQDSLDGRFRSEVFELAHIAVCLA